MGISFLFRVLQHGRSLPMSPRFAVLIALILTKTVNSFHNLTIEDTNAEISYSPQIDVWHQANDTNSSGGSFHWTNYTQGFAVYHFFGAIQVHYVGYGISSDALVNVPTIDIRMEGTHYNVSAYRPRDETNQVILWSSGYLEPNKTHEISVLKLDESTGMDFRIDSFILVIPDPEDPPGILPDQQGSSTSSDPPPPPTPVLSTSNDQSKQKIVIGCAVGGVVLIGGIISIFFFYLQKRKRAGAPDIMSARPYHGHQSSSARSNGSSVLAASTEKPSPSTATTVSPPPAYDNRTPFDNERSSTVLPPYPSRAGGAASADIPNANQPRIIPEYSQRLRMFKLLRYEGDSPVSETTKGPRA